MAFLRHVGKHGDRKVAVVFREVPGEPHMCLVVYTEILNRNIHDPLIKCIESDIGQNSKNLADALNRTHTVDGHIILQKLHAEGMLKKVQTELIVMTPAPNTQIKLSELNQILDEMEKGEAAVQKLAEMDKQMGMQDPVQVAKRMRGDRDAYTPETIPQAPSGIQAGSDALGDNAIANNLRQQALKMSAEAKGLLAEADRLLQEAASLDPATPSPTITVGPTASITPVIDGTGIKRSRGRPKKVANPV
jgi:hypothetical protein